MKRAVNELFDKQERLEKTGYLANTADVVSLYSLDGETVEGLFSAFYPSPRIIETELRLSAEMHVVFEHYCSIHGTPEVKPLSIDPKHDIRLFVRQVPQRLCLEPHDETSADKFPFEDLGRGYLDHYWYYGDDYFDDGLRISVDNRDASLSVVEYFQSELIHKNRLSGFVMLSDVLSSLGGLMDRLDGAAISARLYVSSCQAAHTDSVAVPLKTGVVASAVYNVDRSCAVSDSDRQMLRRVVAGFVKPRRKNSSPGRSETAANANPRANVLQGTAVLRFSEGFRREDVHRCDVQAYGATLGEYGPASNQNQRGKAFTVDVVDGAARHRDHCRRRVHSGPANLGVAT